VNGILEITPDGAGVIATVIPVLLVVSYLDREYLRRMARAGELVAKQMQERGNRWMRYVVLPVPAVVGINTAAVLFATLASCWGIASGEGIHGPVAALVWLMLVAESCNVVVLAVAHTSGTSAGSHGSGDVSTM
jgi:hypothetical protein